MRYEDFISEVRDYEKEVGICDVLYFEVIRKLEHIRTDPRRLTGELARQVIGCFLATWGRMSRNVERRDFDWERLSKSIRELNERFERLRDEKLSDVDFNNEEVAEAIKRIYTRLIKVENLGPTGASKVMHLLNPELFVMWDNNVRDKIRPDNEGRKFAGNADGYLDFLRWIRKELDEAVEDRSLEEIRTEIGGDYVRDKTLAKMADEYCWWKVKKHTTRHK